MTQSETGIPRPRFSSSSDFMRGRFVFSVSDCMMGGYCNYEALISHQA